MKIKITVFVFMLLSSFSYAQQNGKYTVCISPLIASNGSDHWLNYEFGYGSLLIAQYLHLWPKALVPKYDPPHAGDPKYTNDSIYAPLIQAIVFNGLSDAGNLTVIPTDGWGIWPKIRPEQLLALARLKNVDFLITGEISSMKITHQTVTDRKGNSTPQSSIELDMELDITRADTNKFFYSKSKSMSREYFNCWDYGTTDTQAIAKIIKRLQTDIKFWAAKTFIANIPVVKTLNASNKNGALQILAQAPPACEFFSTDKNTKVKDFSVVEYGFDPIYREENATSIAKVKVLQVNDNGANEFKVTAGGTAIVQKLAEGKKLFLVPSYLTD